MRRLLLTRVCVFALFEFCLLNKSSRQKFRKHFGALYMVPHLTGHDPGGVTWRFLIGTFWHHRQCGSRKLLIDEITAPCGTALISSGVRFSNYFIGLYLYLSFFIISSN